MEHPARHETTLATDRSPLTHRWTGALRDRNSPPPASAMQGGAVLVRTNVANRSLTIEAAFNGNQRKRHKHTMSVPAVCADDETARRVGADVFL